MKETGPISNERDYHQVLEEIDGLMDAKAHTSAGERLDALVKLAQAWEEKHCPIDDPDLMESDRS
jgi:antitoxin component HigA of HigAB toxin-antitoxin module